MSAPSAFRLPKDFDWKPWIKRWDRMQERYLVKRTQRFDLIVQIVAATQTEIKTIVDLGCGTGSLTAHLLDAFPEAQVIGIEVDPTLLALAARRTAHFGERVRLLHRDLRKATWTKGLNAASAVVSATALHWLTESQLQRVYQQITPILKAGGIFLNADHVRSDCRPLQRFWEQRRQELRKQKWDPRADDWDTFFKEFLDVLGEDARMLRDLAVGPWEGNDDGYPLAWHVEHLHAAGFRQVECFWRIDCDAIYGGFRQV